MMVKARSQASAGWWYTWTPVLYAAAAHPAVDDVDVPGDGHLLAGVAEGLDQELPGGGQPLLPAELVPEEARHPHHPGTCIRGQGCPRS